jgi:uncharacterized membrane protein YeaQ/YmgE (transglycosylase-associated protein family)
LEFPNTATAESVGESARLVARPLDRWAVNSGPGAASRLSVISPPLPAANTPCPSGSNATAVAGNPRTIRRSPVASMSEMMPSSLAAATVNLQFKEPRDQVFVNLISSIDPQTPLRRVVPTTAPKLSLEVSPNPIDGFGLETATLTVRALGGGSYAGSRITLDYDRGFIGNPQLQLDASGSASTQIRSRYVGTATIKATGRPFGDASVTLDYRAPVLFVFIALVGAAAGAVVRATVKREGKKGFFIAGLCGVIGVVVATLGVNFLNLAVTIPNGEAFAFVVAALSAYLGAGVFSKILGPAAA